MNLPIEQVERLTRGLQSRSMTFLSPDKEAGAFMLYCINKSLTQISAQLSIPPEVILLTAMQYKWEEKIILLEKQEGGLKTMQELQKDLASSILVATLIAAQKQIGDFIAGRITAAECKWLPSNIQGLEKLMSLINGLQPVAQAPVTNITATNVQVNQSSLSPVETKNKLELLKKIENE